ncbi:MAG: NADH-quinone oxidoreductase subunit K [Oscillospiraceae bacterium]|nr:NADH-quinone oxidoreductase subunit K [Oscillospiraceae bacterium]
MLNLILDNRFAIASVILFVTGFVNMMLHPNLIKKIVSFNIMDSATFLMLASRGMIAGRSAAILTDGGADVTRYVNPIPAGLVLTGIVVSVSVSAFSLALVQRIYGAYGTVDMRELLEAMKKKGE